MINKQENTNLSADVFQQHVIFCFSRQNLTLQVIVLVVLQTVKPWNLKVYAREGNKECFRKHVSSFRQGRTLWLVWQIYASNKIKRAIDSRLQTFNHAKSITARLKNYHWQSKAFPGQLLTSRRTINKNQPVFKTSKEYWAGTFRTQLEELWIEEAKFVNGVPGWIFHLRNDSYLCHFLSPWQLKTACKDAVISPPPRPKRHIFVKNCIWHLSLGEPTIWKDEGGVGSFVEMLLCWKQVTEHISLFFSLFVVLQTVAGVFVFLLGPIPFIPRINCKGICRGYDYAEKVDRSMSSMASGIHEKKWRGRGGQSDFRD